MSTSVQKIRAELFRRLAEAETIEETKAAIDAIEKELRSVKWHPVGDRPTNHGTVEFGASAPVQLVERVVNEIEASLQLEAKRRGERPASPREAAQRWFGVPPEGLVAMDNDAIRKLAERTSSLMIADSGDDERPTVIADDKGIGQHPSRWPKTLLSLNESEKVDEPYLIGQYGQGGASTLLYSEYTVIVSRRAPDLLEAGQEDAVGVTAIRYRPLRVRGGTYEYLVAGDGAILAVPAADAPERWQGRHGTRITHVAYALHGYTAAYRRQKSGLWGLLNPALFDPILPVVILGKRRVDLHRNPNADTVGRVAKGNAAILGGLPKHEGAPSPAGDDDVDDDEAPKASGRRGTTYVRYEDDETLAVNGHGTIRVRTWVLFGIETAETYVRADQAVTLTMAGQRHGQAGRDFIKQCRLGFLAKRIVIQLEADELDQEAKRQLFPSARERQREGAMADNVIGVLAEYLMGNEELAALEEIAKNEELAKSTTSVKDSVRRRVAQLIQRHLLGTGFRRSGTKASTAAVTTTGGKMGRTPVVRVPPPDDSSMPTIPTTMEIPNASTKIRAGRAGQVLVKLNAKNGYLGKPGDGHLTVEVTRTGKPTKKIKHTGTGTVRGGRARLVFGAESDTEPGEYTVRVSLVTPRGETLISVGTLEVVPEPAVKAGQEITEGGLPEIKWVKHLKDAASEEERAELEKVWPDGWKDDEVGDVVESNDSLVFRLNESFPELRIAIERKATGPKASATAVELLKDKYAAPVIFGIWLLYQQQKEADAQDKFTENNLRTAKLALARAQLATMTDLELEAEEVNRSEPLVAAAAGD